VWEGYLTVAENATLQAGQGANLAESVGVAVCATGPADYATGEVGGARRTHRDTHRLLSARWQHYAGGSMPVIRR